MFHQCQTAIQRISAKARLASPEEKRLVKNVVSSMASSLQDLSGNFRKSQSSYLKSNCRLVTVKRASSKTLC